MPFRIDENPDAGPLNDLQTLPVQGGGRPDFWSETVPAAFRLENLIGSTWARESADLYERDAFGQVSGLAIDEAFNPMTDENLAGYEHVASRFVDVHTPQQNEALKRNIDREQADRDVIERAGVAGFAATLAAGTLDPTVFLPVGGQLKAGASVLRVSLRAGLAAGVSTVVQEAGLQNSQELRTDLESVLNIGGATLIGGVLGGGAAFLSRKLRGDLGRVVDEDMVLPKADEPDPANPLEMLRADEVDDFPGDLPSQMSEFEYGFDPAYLRAVEAEAEAFTRNGQAADAGAAAVWRPTKEQQQIDNVVARSIARLTAAVPGLSSDPLTRTILSPSLAARETIESLAEVPVTLSKNRAHLDAAGNVVFGQPTRQAVESHIRRYDSLLGQAMTQADDFYIQYLRGRGRRPGDILLSGVESMSGARRRDGRMTRPEFGEAVVHALRSGDRSTTPEVQQAAQALRRDFLDPLKDEAKALGLFGYERVPNPADPDGPDLFVPREPSVAETAESYFPRIYNRERVRAQREQFRQRLFRHFEQRRTEAADRVAQLQDELSASQEAAASFVQEARSAISERNRLARRAREVVDQKKGRLAGAMGRMREALTNANQANRRADAVATRDLPPGERAYWEGFRKQIIRGYGETRPQTLSEWVIAQGGIRDPETMLPSDLLKRRGLVNRRDPQMLGDGKRPGMPLDYLREAAVEDRFIGPDADLNEFVDRLIDDLNGRPHYSEADLDEVAYMEMLADLREGLGRDGFDVHAMNAEELAAWHTGEGYQRSTASMRARAREAAKRVRDAERRLLKADEAADAAEATLDDVRAAAMTMRELMPDQTRIADEARKAHRSARRDIARLRRDLFQAEQRAQKTDDDLLADADQTINRILSGPEGRIDGDGPASTKRFRAGANASETISLSGRFHERALDIADADIADFLESDLNYGLRVMVRSMAPDIQMIKRFGSVDMELELRKVIEEFDAMAGVAGRAGDERLSSRIARQKTNAIRDLMGVRDRLRGTYRLPGDPESLSESAARMAVSANYLRLMGGVTVSSVPDMARAVFTHGLGRSMRPILSAFTGSLSSLKGMDAELKAAGPGFEMILNTRALAMADILDDYGRHTQLERMIDTAQSHFGYASLIAPWNRGMKGISGYATQNRLIDAMMRLQDGKVRRSDAELLARLGISEANARNIAAQFLRHGQTDALGNRIARSDQWEYPALRNIWLNAIRKEVDRLIVTPGQDKPLFASTSLGQVIMQFRSYNFAATQRVLISYAQGLISSRDAHVAMALITQVGLGMLVAKHKAEQYGIDTSGWGPEKWLIEGVDRAGLLAVFSDINMMVEYGSAGNLGLSALAGDGRMSRYASRNAVGQFMGPTAGLAADAFSAAAIPFEMMKPEDEREIHRSQIRAARRLIPFQNLFYVRSIFDRIEDSVGTALEAEGESIEERKARLEAGE